MDKPWHSARPGVKVKLLAQQSELYVLAESQDRIAKERSMRRRQLKWLWGRLKELSAMTLTREELLMKLGAAKQNSPSAWRLVKIEVAKPGASFSYRLHREKLRRARRREGRYLLRTNLTETEPAKLWSLYLQLVAVEEAFKNLKGDLAVRPIFHQKRKARRSAHLRVVSGLLSARDAGTTVTFARARTDATKCAGEIRRHANDRRAFAYHRRSRDHSDALPHNPSPNSNCYWTNSNYNYRHNRRPKSALLRATSAMLCSADLWKSLIDLSTTYNL